MRVWADVFDPKNKKIGVATKINSAAVTRAMDGAGNVNLTYPVADETTFNLLQKENRVHIYVEEDDQPRLLGRGVIRDINLDETNTKALIMADDSRVTARFNSVNVLNALSHSESA